jgi:hypothetical protein
VIPLLIVYAALPTALSISPSLPETTLTVTAVVMLVVVPSEPLLQAVPIRFVAGVLPSCVEQ